MNIFYARSYRYSKSEANSGYFWIYSTTPGEDVSLVGFGTFKVSHRAEREGRNPATGESMTIKASNVVGFKSGKDLKEAVNT